MQKKEHFQRRCCTKQINMVFSFYFYTQIFQMTKDQLDSRISIHNNENEQTQPTSHTSVGSSARLWEGSANLSSRKLVNPLEYGLKGRQYTGVSAGTCLSMPYPALIWRICLLLSDRSCDNFCKMLNYLFSTFSLNIYLCPWKNLQPLQTSKAPKISIKCLYGIRKSTIWAGAHLLILCWK